MPGPGYTPPPILTGRPDLYPVYGADRPLALSFPLTDARGILVGHLAVS